jgi:hypothetical protein
MLNDMLYPPPADNRIDFCDEYARELACCARRTGEAIECYIQETHPLPNGIRTELEWKWIVREANKMRCK